LKQVMIPPVNQRHPNRFIVKRPRGIQSPKPTANDDDMW
jgi:hypothetical protein